MSEASAAARMEPSKQEQAPDAEQLINPYGSGRDEPVAE